MPALAGDTVQAGQYQVVAWDLDTTGRRLIDEICQIAGHFSSSTATAQSERSFSQYVMPHRNPNPGARRSFGIKVKLVRGQCPALPSALYFDFSLLLLPAGGQYDENHPVWSV